MHGTVICYEGIFTSFVYCDGPPLRTILAHSRYSMGIC